MRVLVTRVRLEADAAVLGMTDIAQTMGGRMVQVSWKKTGRSYQRGRSVAVIESAKWVGPFPTPLSGEIMATNETGFKQDILLANKDPYGAGWLVRLKPARFEEEWPHLLPHDQAFDRYREKIAERDLQCYRCAD